MRKEDVAADLTKLAFDSSTGSRGLSLRSKRTPISGTILPAQTRSQGGESSWKGSIRNTSSFLKGWP